MKLGFLATEDEVKLTSIDSAKVEFGYQNNMFTAKNLSKLEQIDTIELFRRQPRHKGYNSSFRKR